MIRDGNSDMIDERSPMERTGQEPAKSLNFMVKFITFTTETEKDFSNGLLATLDFQTKVQESDTIMFKFFSKPMANNITLQ